jgi:addiction module HigA family antidote
MSDSSPLKRDRRPTHPGVLLKELYLLARGIHQNAFAADIEISEKHLSRLVNGHVRLEPKVAGKIAKVLGTSVDLWLNLQTAVDTWDTQEALADWKPRNIYEAPEPYELELA